MTYYIPHGKIQIIKHGSTKKAELTFSKNIVDPDFVQDTQGISCFIYFLSSNDRSRKNHSPPET